MSHDRILILDFGSQVTQLIARRVREAHVYCEVHPNDVSADFIRSFNPKGIILSGSHMSAYEESNDQASEAVFSAGVPVLGICYGMQTMAQQLGGKVESGAKREFGYAEVRAHNHTRLLEGIEDFKSEDGHGMLKVWMSHGDKVTELPPGFKVMCSTPSCPIAGMCDEERGFYALQFHPEVTHTVKGRAMLERFVLDICGCNPDWIMGDYVAEAIAKIRDQVGEEEVILGLSGGVDSSVAAALIHRAIGKQLTCVFVDNGLLRKNEREQVRETFEKNMGLKLVVVDAVDRFMNALAGVTANNPGALTADGKDIMWIMLMLVAALSFIASAIPIFFYKFTEKEQQKAVVEIERRKAEKLALAGADGTVVTDDIVDVVVGADGEVESVTETEEVDITVVPEAAEEETPTETEAAPAEEAPADGDEEK